MERPLLIPRQALAELLRATGSPLTPEAYLAALPRESAFRKYPSRARISWWSKSVLAAAVVLSVLALPFLFDFESILLLALISVFTVIEFRVNRFFVESNPEAPVLGFRNQSAIAATILFYGLYHATVSDPLQLPAEYLSVIDAPTQQLLKTTMRAGYFAVGVAGGLCQFGLAWYYLNARVNEEG